MEFVKNIFNKIYRSRGHSSLFLSYLIIYVLLFSFFRIIFTKIYFYRLENIPITDILHALLIGLRFDLSSAATLLFPIFLLSTIPFFNRFRLFRNTWSFAPNILLILIIVYEIADLIYFENGNKHLGYEGFTLIFDVPLLFKSALYNNPIFIVIALAGLIATFSFSIFIFIKYVKVPPLSDNRKTAIIRFLISFTIIIIFMRGGFQSQIIRPSFAILGQNQLLNNLPLNPIFTMFVDMRSYMVPRSKKMSYNEALWFEEIIK